MPKLLNVRVPDEQAEAWRRAAADRGVSLSELIRSGVEQLLSTTLPVAPIEAEPRPRVAAATAQTAAESSPAPRRRTAAAATSAKGKACPRERHHRRGVFCRQCGRIPGG